MAVAGRYADAPTLSWRSCYGDMRAAGRWRWPAVIETMPTVDGDGTAENY